MPLLICLKRISAKTPNAMKFAFQWSKTRGESGIFRGEALTGYGETPIPTDNILQVQGGGVVNFIYIDALQDTGATQAPITTTLSVEAGDRGELRLYGAESGKLISGFSVGTGSFEAGERLRLELIDKDLNLSQEVIDTVRIVASGNVLKDEVALMLEETENDSAIFAGELRTRKFDQTGRPDATTQREGKIEPTGEETTQLSDENSSDTAGKLQPGADDVLQVTDKERITVEYIDMLTATGEPHVPVQVNAIVLGGSAGLLRIVDRDGVRASIRPESGIGKIQCRRAHLLPLGGFTLKHRHRHGGSAD